MTATAIRWRLQTKAKTGRWINRGLFETRSMARLKAAGIRMTVGFGNVRVVRYQKGVA